MSESVITRDTSSGRIHLRYPTPSGGLATLEGDNLDDAGEYEVIDEATLADAEPEALCDRCFPSGETSA
jgi:hypothetical protein